MQTIRGQRRPCKPAVTRSEDFRNLVGTRAAPADLQQSTGDCANHVLEKAAAANPENPFCFGPFPGCGIDGPNPVLGLGCGRAERREIMVTQKIIRSPIQRAFEQGVTEWVHIPATKRAHHSTAPEAIFVGL